MTVKRFVVELAGSWLLAVLNTSSTRQRVDPFAGKVIVVVAGNPLPCAASLFFTCLLVIHSLALRARISLLQYSVLVRALFVAAYPHCLRWR